VAGVGHSIVVRIGNHMLLQAPLWDSVVRSWG
jgi:hypothetical protein